MIKNCSNALIYSSFLPIKEYQFIGLVLFSVILLVSIIIIIINSKSRCLIETLFSIVRDKNSKLYRFTGHKLDVQDTSPLKVQDYAPLDNIKEHPYFLSIDSALKEANVKNFAIIGNYSSGKSSVIQSYFKNHSFNGRKFKNNEYLSISLAEFEYTNSLKEKEDYQSSLIDLEKEIVRQIFCSSLRKYIPISFASSLKKSKHFICTLTLFITLILAVTICYDSNKQVPKLLMTYYNFCLSNVIAFGVFISVIAILIYRLLSIFSIKILSYASVIGSFKIELEKNSSNSVLDEFSEQILYLFKKSKCNYVIFEDLERTKNYEVFTHLRNLNLLINNNLTKKRVFRKSNRKIVFIYLITETVFKSHLDIVKFFDYTLSICPVLSISNSCSHMIKIRKELYEFYKNKSDKKLQKIYDSEKYSRMYSSEYLSNDYLLFLSNFIFDLRLIKKIFNDYQTLFGGFTNIDNLHEFSEVIFLLTVLRAMYTKEYYELSKNEGVICEILNKVIQLSDNKELTKSELASIRKKYKNCDILKNDFIFEILKAKKFAENYRLFMSNLSDNILSDKDIKYILSLFDSKLGYIPDLELSLDDGKLDIILSYFPSNLIKKKQVLNWSLFSSLIQKSKIKKKYEQFVKQYFKAIIEDKYYGRDGFVFLIDLINVMFTEAVEQVKKKYEIESVPDFNESSNINDDKQLNFDFLTLMRKEVRMYLENYFSIIFDNEDKKAIFEKIISRVQSPEENFDFNDTSFSQDLALFIVLFFEYVIEPTDYGTMKDDYEDYTRIVSRYTNKKDFDDVFSNFQFLHKPIFITEFLSN